MSLMIKEHITHECKYHGSSSGACTRLKKHTEKNIQSWSKVMVHLAFFDNFTIPSPSPPHNVGSVRSKCPLWSNIVWGQRGRPSLGKRAAFIIKQGAILKTANFQSVPYTFDQDCSYVRMHNTNGWLETKLVVVFNGNTVKFFVSFSYYVMEMRTLSLTSCWGVYVVLFRQVNMAELRRIRRQFITYAKSHPVEDTGKISNMFVQYLNNSFK